ncbi:myeloid differentiation primary response protein MyD88 [Wyeomyia smithii]|uniref:myeloid differentiation primary response protein MyD88 n=1 Tax=Wyeomyia smithii TaxID=174621 RepID=UPI0024681AEE|nr:myeloid differentiation primary response protein MyD88 [Wyeomyia smithii]
MINRAIQNPTENTVPYTVDFNEVPLSALRQPTYQLLSALLNRKKIFKSEEGYWRDWRGMFQAIGLENHYISELENNANPTKRVLQLWQQMSDSIKLSANLKELQNVLGFIDRWDVLDSSNKYLVDDAMLFLTERHKTLCKKSKLKLEEENNIDDYLGLDEDIITIDDTRSKKQIYDAFVLFADADVEFATKMIERLEERHLKVCVKDRDLLAGISFEHEAIIRLISERCRRLVIVISKEFLSSPLNEFFVTFAQALQIEQKKRKIIPCVYKRLLLPPNLQFYFTLDYERSNKLYNFWDKLEDAIKAKKEPSMSEIKKESKSVDSLTVAASITSTYEPSLSLATESIPEKQSKELVTVVPAQDITSRQSTKSSLVFPSIPGTALPNEHKKRKWFKFTLPSPENRKTDEGITDNQKKNKTKWYKSNKKIATAL